MEGISTCILDMFQLGKQEDAEEFLSYILDGLHEEMTTLIKFANGTPTGIQISIKNYNKNISQISIFPD